MTHSRCPTCAAELENNSVCYRCGTLPGVEAAVRNAKRSVGTYWEEKTSGLTRGFKSHHLLWILAIIPFFMLPPLAALIYAIAAMRKRDGQAKTNVEWLAIISAVNLVVSALLLYKFYFVFHDLLLQGPDLLRAFIRRWLGTVGPDPRPPVKTTPV